jgi:hypothetical protein
MKKFGLILSLFAFVLNSYGQGEQTVKQATEIVYYGIDFTQLTVIGEDVFVPSDYITRHFLAWNGVVRLEREKYEFDKVFKKANVEYDMDMIDQLNAKRDPSTIIVTEPTRISEDDLVRIVSNYNPSQSEGVGLVIVAENFNKPAEIGTMWLVFFDIKTNTILMAKYMSAKPGGFGMKNFWARTVYNVLQESKSKYPKWVK